MSVVISIRTLTELVSEVTGVAVADIRSESRLLSISRARHLAMWAAYAYPHRGPAAIGRIVDKDHSSVLYAVAKIEAEIAAGERVRHIPADVLAVVDAVDALAERMAAASISEPPDIDPLDVARIALVSPGRAATLSVAAIRAMAGYVVALAAADTDPDRPMPPASGLCEEPMPIEVPAPAAVVKAAQAVVTASRRRTEATTLREEQYLDGVVGRRVADLAAVLDEAGMPALRPQPTFKTASNAHRKESLHG